MDKHPIVSIGTDDHPFPIGEPGHERQGLAGKLRHLHVDDPSAGAIGAGNSNHFGWISRILPYRVTNL